MCMQVTLFDWYHTLFIPDNTDRELTIEDVKKSKAAYMHTVMRAFGLVYLVAAGRASPGSGSACARLQIDIPIRECTSHLGSFFIALTTKFVLGSVLSMYRRGSVRM